MNKIFRVLSTSAIKNDLVAGCVTDGRAFVYFWLVMCFDAMQIAALMISPAQGTTADVIYARVYFIGAIIFFPLLWLANGGSKGKDFFIRWFPIAFVVGIKYVILSYILHYLPYYIDYLVSIRGYHLVVSIGVYLMMIFSWLYHMRDVAKRTAS